MSQLTYERMRDAIEQLNMPRALENVDALLDRVANTELSIVEMLDHLFSAELSARRERSIAMRLKLAGLPATKTVEHFDFAFQPSLDEVKIRDLHTLRFLANGHNVIFLRPVRETAHEQRIALQTAYRQPCQVAHHRRDRLRAA